MARTNNLWKTGTGGTYIQTIGPSGYDILINGSSKYLNFDTIVGSSGYGIRDNAGVMEFKDSGGTWTTLISLGISIGDTVTGGTTGSVLFVGAASVLAQDNANFFWDDTNNRLGIGTASPSTFLHILGTTEQLRLGYDVSNYNSFTTSSIGGLAIASTGTNGNITLTPSGTGGIASTSDAFLGLILTRGTTATGGRAIQLVNGAGNYWVVGTNGSSTSPNNGYSWQYNATSFLSPVPLMSLSTSGHLLMGGLTIDGTGVLQFPTATTSAGGIGFSTDLFAFRDAAGSLQVSSTGGSTAFRMSHSSSTVGFQLISATNPVMDYIGNMSFRAGIGGSATLTLDSSQNATFAKKIASYNGVSTAGWGVPAIYKAGRATAQTAANTSVSTYTVGAADGSFEVSANVLVTTSSAEAFTVTVDYTDEGNTARTITLNFQLVAGTIGTAINFANGAVPYEGIPIHIRAKASTAITVKTVGTFTGATYNVEGIIKQTA